MGIGNETTSSLVLECVQCKQKFLNENERDNHEQETYHKVKEHYPCPKCEKHFGNLQILQLHLRVHESGQHCLPTDIHNTKLDENSKDTSENEEESIIVKNVLPNCVESNNKKQPSSLPAKKSIGLTKIRLEDCLRCDACSCIYIDKNDYNKHMKNFHRQNSPKKHNKQRKGCRSCCKHCNCQGNHEHQNVQKERGNNNLFHYNIKDRWTKMVSRRLGSNNIKREIKDDPDGDSADGAMLADYSHLLSQVEVKIKTEPVDDSESCGSYTVEAE